MSAKPKLTLRKPPKPDEFVFGAPGHPSAQAPRRSTITRADGRELRKLTVYLPAGLAKRLRAHCLDLEVDVSQYVTTLVDAEIGSRGR